MRVIGIISITNYHDAHFTTYFLNEFFENIITTNRQIPIIIINNITNIENKSSAYTDEYQYNKIVNILGEEIESLVHSYPDKIVVLCNVAHLYIGTVLSRFPKAKSCFLDIVECAVAEAQKLHMKDVLVLCSKNAQNSKIFDKYFSRYGISVSYVKDDQDIIHSLMYDVENNCVNDKDVYELYNLCLKYRNYNMYFACTELSFIYGKNKNLFSGFKIIDTVECVIQKLCQTQND